ncbi:MAG: hypothetical protein A2X46_03380 [Lentisphaerae bacterium GWF2_57_35]|nr:MAG: hypothetical protein A2X46_03380 [Lentisphaerae bacterium GWF2_57_35]
MSAGRAIGLMLGFIGVFSFDASAQPHRIADVEYAVLSQTASTLRRMEAPASASTEAENSITINTQRTFQTIEGVGGAFSEIGGEALSHLDAGTQTNVLSHLFGSPTGAGFTFCRLPIGASDFALSAYSLNDTPDDYAMSQFTVERDEKYLLPYVQAALQMAPSLQFHACPWSPPGWLKTNGKMIGGGQLRNQPEAHRAYAVYLRKFIQAYEAKGIRVNRIFIQNEPNREMKYPSCLMPPKQMTRFVADYLKPEFELYGLSTKIWAGAYQEKTSQYAHQGLADKAFAKAVAGVGFQYSDSRMVQDIRLMCPWLPVMHTESECFDGSNNSLQAQALFAEVVKYMEAGCTVFTYWNMILNEQQCSSWGWAQNSLITIDRKNKTVSYRPDWAVMSLVSKMARPGARRCEAFSTGRFAPLAFQNIDDSVVLLLWTESGSTVYRVRMADEEFNLNLPANSLCAIRMVSTDEK